MKISKIFFFSIICLNFYNFASACYERSVVEVYDNTKHKDYEALQEDDPNIKCLCGRNTLKHENNYYVINAYPINFDKAANNYIQFADLINTNENHFKQDCVKMFEAISLLGDLKLAVPEILMIMNGNVSIPDENGKSIEKIYKKEDLQEYINAFKNKWLKQAKLKESFLDKINIQGVESKSFGTLKELKKASLEAINPLKKYCDSLVLQFAKELFKYIRFFNEEVPDLSNCNALENLTTIDTDTYNDVLKKLQQCNVSDIFQQEKNIVNKYLHTEHMLYYNLTKNGNPISCPVHFVSYLRMCSSCEKLWATKTPCEENKHNTVCFFKVGNQNINKENINTSFLQIASPDSIKNM